ncbi:MAG: hypothetical protein ACUVRP_03020 [Chlorobiales bacterium]
MKKYLLLALLLFGCTLLFAQEVIKLWTFKNNIGANFTQIGLQVLRDDKTVGPATQIRNTLALGFSYAL